MRIRSLLPLVLASACNEPKERTPADPADTDSGAADSETGDTDTGGPDTGDTGPTEPIAHAWADELEDADLVVGSCGSDDEGTHVVAPGPDLDGDGLPELAIGAPGHDLSRVSGGAVYFFRGSDVVDGLGAWDAYAVVHTDEREMGFGSRVSWVGDRDGDGVDDLVVGYERGFSTVPGADLLAGGDVTPSASFVPSSELTFVRWADVDRDGVDDWLFGHSGRYGEGAVSVVRDADFTLALVTASESAYGSTASDDAGRTLVALHEDWDGDGIPEFATILYDTLHVIGSARLLAGEDQLADAALTGAPYLSGHQVLAPGDIDGDGLDELLVFQAGNKLCVLNGADYTGESKICIRDEGLGPDEAVLGDDLDGDGVPEVWFTRDGWLVAQDVGALAQGIELELARMALPGTAERLAAADGVVWASPEVASEDPEAEIAWAHTASFTPQRAVTVYGGKWGGIPEIPAWRDVTGDGVVDLVLDDAAGGGLAAFDGATLAEGGARTWCDATWTRPWTGVTTRWLDDVNGDGADDALLTRYQDGGTWLHEVWSGPVAIGAVEGDAPLASWTSEADLEPLAGCDLDGDGHEDLVADGVDGAELLAGGAVGADGFRRLGAIRTDSTLDCLPDADGDGGDELYVRPRSDRAHLFRSSQLDPATTLEEEAAGLTIEGEDLSVGEPLRAADGSGRVGWWLQVDGDYQLCLFELAGLAGTVASADVPRSCLEDVYASAVVDTWLDEATGDTTLDIVLHAGGSVRVVDGATLGRSDLLVYVDAEERRITDVGPGSDVFGVGARAIWTLGDDPDAAYHLDWTRLDVLFAHPPEEP